MTWSKGGGAFDMAAMAEQLDAMLTEQRRPVTARWLCHANAVSVAEAKAALEQYAQEHADDVAVTYLLTGVSKARGACHVQLAHAAQLETARAALEGPCQQEIYALAPAAASAADPLALTAQTIEQSRELVNAVMTKSDDPKVSAFAQNAASAVRCGACRRKADDRPPARPTPAAAAPAAASGAQKATGKAKSAGDVGKDSKKAGEAAASAPKEAATPAVKADLAKEKVAAPEAADASAKKGKKGGSALASAFSKAPARPAKKAKAAPAADAEQATAPSKQQKPKSGPAAKQRTAQPVLDDASGDEDMSTSPSPLETRRAGARRQVLADSDDDDDDFAAAPSGSAPAAPAGGALAGTPAEAAAGEVPSKRAAGAAAGPPSKPKQARVEGAPAAGGPVSGKGAAAVADGKYGAPPDPDAELKTDGNGKAYWSYINDRGEDVSIAAVPVASRKSQSGPAESAAPASNKKVKSEASEASAKESKPSKVARGGSKQSKGAPAKGGFGDIRNMFGKGKKG